jgi:hypothetical protein
MHFLACQGQMKCYLLERTAHQFKFAEYFFLTTFQNYAGQIQLVHSTTEEQEGSLKKKSVFAQWKLVIL